jgi:hypothetical protein
LPTPTLIYQIERVICAVVREPLVPSPLFPYLG